MRVSTWSWILLGSLWSLKVLLAVQLDLFGDEAFYWWEAQHLDWAFDDVPVATPALIAASTALLGDAAWAIRLPFLLIAAASTWMVGLLAWRIEGDARRFERALLVASAMPLAAFQGMLALPDVPLTFAMLCALYAMLRLGQSQGREGAWLLAAAMALGALSHYRWIVPLGVAALAVLLLEQTRVLIREPRIWMFGLGGLALGWLPLIWQQGQSGGRGLVFQLVERHPWVFQWEKLLDPLLQSIVVSPLLFVLLLATSLRSWGARSFAALWLSTCGLGLLLAYWSLGLFTDDTRSWLHWPMPAFLAMVPLLAARRFGAVERSGLGLAWAFTLATGAFFLVLVHAPQWLARTSLYQHNFSGWSEAAAMVRANVRTDTTRPVPVLADDFMLAAELQHELGPGYEVYAADHPNNDKHGRQTVLSAIGRDESSYRSVLAGRPVWLIMDQSATPLRQRAERAAGWCARLQGLTLQAEQFLDLGEKRLFLLRSDGEPGACVLPVFGYADDQLGPWSELEGFLLSPTGAPLEARARIGERVLPLEYPVLVHGIDGQLPAVSDPRLPRVGITGQIPPDVLDGTWVILEARQPGRPWSEIAAARIGRR